MDATRPLHAPEHSIISDDRQRPLRVDPNYPLATSIPPIRRMEKSHLQETGLPNTVARTTSRKRRPSGTGQGQYESFPRPGPEVPELPQGPPVSYRGPSGSNPPADLAYNDPTSFAARTRRGPNDVALYPESPIENKFDSMAQTTRQNRRGSIRRSSIPKPIADHTASPHADATPANQHASPQTARPNVNAGDSQIPQVAHDRKSRTGLDGEGHDVAGTSHSSRRASATGVDPRKEWAAGRSPLQKLEGKLIDISKEEKRARVEEAEQLLQQRKDGSARSKRDSDADRTSNPTTERDRTDAQKRRSNRRSAIGVSVDKPSSRRDVPSSIPDRHHGDGSTKNMLDSDRQDIPLQSSELRGSRDMSGRTGPDATIQLNGESQRTRIKRQSLTQATQDSTRLSHNQGLTDSRLQRDRSQDQRTPRFESNDASPRKGDVRFASQEKSIEADRPTKQVPKQQQGLYNHKAQKSGEEDSAAEYGGRKDPLPRRAVQSNDPAFSYEIPPQTAGGIAARQKVAFGGEPTVTEAAPAPHQNRLSKLLHRSNKTNVVPPEDHTQRPRHLDDWRKASTAKLTAANFASVPFSIADAPNKYNTWWDKDTSSRRVIANATNPEVNSNIDFENARFQPALYLKCGPLLRFTGLQRSKLEQLPGRRGLSASEREVWRGSILIVTLDSESDYNSAPILEIFPEPMDLLPPPPPHFKAESGHDLPQAYLDPVAGLPRLTRDGGIVYVRPTEDLEHGQDLSRVEDDDGLFEQTRTANVPTSYGRPNSAPASNGKVPSGNSRTRRSNSQKSIGSQVKGARLHAERGVTFWRFNIEIELTERQQRIGYRINSSASVGFWVPARGQTMNMMFHSCNGFSMSVDTNEFSGPDPLWRDVLNNHQSRPFHVMIGGGDQIYNDRVMSETELFQDWLGIKNPHHKHQAPFSLEMRDELEAFYLERYSMWFSQGLFGMANSQIPMINVWDDHDIIDGFGSYPHHFMSTPVFCGLGAIAFKYYMLFQHQSVVDEGPAEEPSWLLGAAPGPYINELSRSLFMSLGKNVAFLGLDCRTERMRDAILSEATYDLAFQRCRREIVEGETKHLIVLLGVPIAYPRLNFLENVLTSRIMDPIKALGRTGLLGGFINKFDGGVEILDDLDDHWTAKHHKQERNWFIQELQELAAEKSIRITILGGDVHLAAIGQFYSSPKLKLTKDRDHRYIPNVISSAIVNTPPPEIMADILNKRDKKHYVDKEDKETLEDMIPMFTHDVDGKNRNNKRLLPRRNWCSIREYHPGSTPPPTPPESEHSFIAQESPEPRPNRLQRTLSLTRGDAKPGNLIRRLSGRARAASPDYPISNQYQTSPRMPESPLQPQEDYFAQSPRRASTLPASYSNGAVRHSSAPLPRPGNFHRRPTNMSEKAVLKGGADTVHKEDETTGHINLEYGLDICINCEVNQKDPAGVTVPYRLLVPALWYEGSEDANHAAYRKKGVIERFKSISLGRNRKSGLAKRQGQGEWGGGSSSYTPSISESGDHQMGPPQQQARPVISNPIPLHRPQEDKGYTGRRLSKADRMLGTAPDDPPAMTRTTSSGKNAATLAGQGDQVSRIRARTNSYNANSNSNNTGANGPEPFQPRPSRNQGSIKVDNNSNGIVLGQGAKVSSAGSRATGPQGLQTGNGSVKMGSGDKVRSATLQRSGSRGYQAPQAGVGEDVILGRGEKVKSGGIRADDVRYHPDDHAGDEYSEASYEEEEPVQGAGGNGGKAQGYGGIEAYKEKSWRRFF
ncbi:MAG: hypothetical protein Q9202_001217 [Teloschistes flavicans]